MNMTMIWYLMAKSGEEPAKIKPVIMPGNCTSPTVFIESTVGWIAARMLSCTRLRAASLGAAPKQS